GEVPQDRRKRDGGRRDRERESEGTEAERPEEAAANRRRAHRRLGGQLRHALRRRGSAVGREPATDDLDHSALSGGELVLSLGKCAQHPAGEDLLERSVEDEADEARVDIGTELTILLAARDDPLDRIERFVDLRHALLQIGAANDLADDDADEIRISPPRTQEDLRDAGKTIACRLVRLLD